jgi:hypothetical protein
MRWRDVGWSGRHWTASASLPRLAWAIQSPGEQLLLRAISTVRLRAQEFALVALY